MRSTGEDGGSLCAQVTKRSWVGMETLGVPEPLGLIPAVDIAAPVLSVELRRVAGAPVPRTQWTVWTRRASNHL